MNAQIREAACEWFVEFRVGEPGEAARGSFLAWLRESPTHMAAYLEVAALWSESGAVDAGKRGSIEELVSQARAEPDNVVALSLPASATVSSVLGLVAEEPSVSARLVGRLTHGITAVAASIVLALSFGIAWWIYLQPDVYVTTVGEQRTVTLADDSIVRLNARSRVAVKLSGNRRAVELLEGQAFFQVAKDIHRPFTVTSDGMRVQAVGTEFDVRRKRSSLVVTVVEGRVAVFGVPARVRSAPSNVRAGPVYVSAGEQVTMSAAGPGSAKPVDLSMVTAWTRRQLVFAATPLIDVAEEFNLYNARRLVIRDPSLENFQVDGVFSSPDPAPLIRFLRSKPGVRIVETESEIVIESATTGEQEETQ
jgi:transmembrane sensor